MSKTKYRGLPEGPRKRLAERCRGRCERCGGQMDQMDAHHRKQRSLGGKHTLDNVVGMHRRCHDRVHQVNSYEDGWLLRSVWVPSLTPIRMFDGWFLLDADGSMRSVDGQVGQVPAPDGGPPRPLDEGGDTPGHLVTLVADVLRDLVDVHPGAPQVVVDALERLGDGLAAVLGEGEQERGTDHG